MTVSETTDQFRAMCADAQVHTVEVAVVDTVGHLRGKRIPVARFFDRVVETGYHMADAIFVMDVQNGLPDNEFINMDTGYLDCHIVPDLTTGRVLPHRPGYALVFSDVFDEHGNPHPLAPRTVLREQMARYASHAVDPVVATELEFYFCTSDWEPIQRHIQYSSLTESIDVEDCLYAIREAMAGAGLDVESSNAEYGPGQFEVNTGPADALTAAENAVLQKSIVKQVARQFDLRATFMAKPWAAESGSSMHLHTSLADQAGANAFADADGGPTELMGHWIAGQLAHAEALTLPAMLGFNSPKRLQPFTFAPTHAHWGLDNRSVLCRCIAETGSSANRVENRLAGADANPYLAIAGLVAAGLDGVEQKLKPPVMCEGDMYSNPGSSPALPTDLASAVDAFAGSPLAGLLGDRFSASFASMGAAEAEMGAAETADTPADQVSRWEFERYREQV